MTAISYEDDVILDEEESIEQDQQEDQHWYPRRQRHPSIRYGIDEYVDVSFLENQMQDHKALKRHYKVSYPKSGKKQLI